MIARLVPDRSFDIENLERVECQAAVVPLGICQTGDRIEDCLVNGPARTRGESTRISRARRRRMSIVFTLAPRRSGRVVTVDGQKPR